MSRRGANASDLRKYKLRLSPSPSVVRHSNLVAPFKNQANQPSPVSEIVCVINGRRQDKQQNGSATATAAGKDPPSSRHPPRDDRERGLDQKQNNSRSSSCERLARDIRDKIARQLLSYKKSRDSIGSKDENLLSPRPPAAKESNPIRIHHNSSDIGGGGSGGGGSGGGGGGGSVGGGDRGGGRAGGASGAEAVASLPNEGCNNLKGAGERGARRCPTPCTFVCVTGKKGSSKVTLQVPLSLGSTEGSTYSVEMAGRRGPGSDTTKKARSSTKGRKQKEHKEKGKLRITSGEQRHHGDRGGDGERKRFPPTASYIYPQLQMLPPAAIPKGPAFVTYPSPSRHKHSTRFATSQHKFAGVNRLRRRLSRSQMHAPSTQVASTAFSDNDQGLMLLVLPQGRGGKNEKADRSKRKKVEFAKSDRTSASGAMVSSPSEMMPIRSVLRKRPTLMSYLAVPPPTPHTPSMPTPPSLAPESSSMSPPTPPSQPQCISVSDDTDEAYSEAPPSETSSGHGRFTLWSLSKRLSCLDEPKSSSSLPPVASPLPSAVPDLPLFTSTPSNNTSEAAESSPSRSSTSDPLDEKETCAPTVIQSAELDTDVKDDELIRETNVKGINANGCGAGAGHFDNDNVKMDACVSASVASSTCTSTSAIHVRVTSGQPHLSATRTKKTEPASEDQPKNSPQCSPTSSPRRSPSVASKSLLGPHVPSPATLRGKSTHSGGRGDISPEELQDLRHSSACSSPRCSHKPRNKYTVSKGITACLSSPSVSDADCEAARESRRASPEGSVGHSVKAHVSTMTCSKAVTVALSVRSRSEEACSIPDAIFETRTLRSGISAKRHPMDGMLASSQCISEGDVSIPGGAAVRHSSDGSTGYRRSFRELRPLRAATNGTSGYSTSTTHRMAATHTRSSESFLAASLIVNAPSCRRPSQSIDLSLSRHTPFVRVSSASMTPSVRTEKSPRENAYPPSPPSSRDDESKTARTEISKTHHLTNSDPIPQSAWVDSKEQLRPNSCPYPSPVTTVLPTGSFSPKTTFIQKPNILQNVSSTDSKVSPVNSQNVSKEFTESQTNALGMTINSQTTSLPSTMLSGFSSNSFPDNSSNAPFNYSLQFHKNTSLPYPGASSGFVPSAPSAAFLMAQELYIRRELEKLIADVTKSVEELQEAARACLNESFTSTKTATKDGTEKATETAMTEEEEEAAAEAEKSNILSPNPSDTCATKTQEPAPCQHCTRAATRESSARDEPRRPDSPESRKSSCSEKSTEGLSESENTLMIVIREGDTSTSPDDSGEVVLAVESADENDAEDLKYDGTEEVASTKLELNDGESSIEDPKKLSFNLSTEREETTNPHSQTSSVKRYNAGRRSSAGRRSAGRRSSGWRRRRRRFIPRSPFGYRSGAGRFVSVTEGDAPAKGSGEKRKDSGEVKTSWSLLQQRWLSGAVTHILGLSRLWRREHSASVGAMNASAMARRSPRVATRAVGCGRSVQSGHSARSENSIHSAGKSEGISSRPSVIKGRSPRRRHRKPSYSTSEGSTLTSLWLERVRRAGTTLGFTTSSAVKPKDVGGVIVGDVAPDASESDSDGGDQSSPVPASASGSSESTHLPHETPSPSSALSPPLLSSPQSVSSPGSGSAPASLARTFASHSSSLLQAVVPALRAFVSSGGNIASKDDRPSAEVCEKPAVAAILQQRCDCLTSSCICLPTSHSQTSSDEANDTRRVSKGLSVAALPRRSLLELTWNQSEADSEAPSIESSECSLLGGVRPETEESPQLSSGLRTTTSGPNKDLQKDSKLSDPSPNVSGHSTLRQSTVPFLVERLMADLQHCVRWSKAQRRRIALADIAKTRQLRRCEIKGSRAQARVKQAAILLTDAPLPTISEDAGRKKKSAGDIGSFQTTVTRSIHSQEFSTISELSPDLPLPHCPELSDHVLRQRILLNLKPRRKISSGGAKVRRHSASPTRTTTRTLTPTTEDRYSEARDQGPYLESSPVRRGNSRDSSCAYRKSPKPNERSISPRRKSSRMRSPPKELFSNQDASSIRDQHSCPLQQTSFAEEKRGVRGGAGREEKNMRGSSSSRAEKVSDLSRLRKGSPLIERKFERDYSSKDRYLARKRKGDEDRPSCSSGGMHRENSPARHSTGKFKSVTNRRVSQDGMHSRDTLLAKRRTPKRRERSARHSCSVHQDQRSDVRDCALTPERLSAKKKKEPWPSTTLNCPDYDLELTACAHPYKQKMNLSEDCPMNEPPNFWENAECALNRTSRSSSREFKESLQHADIPSSAFPQEMKSAGELTPNDNSLPWTSERFDEYLDFSPVTTPTFDLSINTWSERTKLFSGASKSPKGNRARTVAEALFKSVTSITRSGRRRKTEKKSENARETSATAIKDLSKRRKKGSPQMRKFDNSASSGQVLCTLQTSDRLSVRGVRRADALIDIRLAAPQRRHSDSEASQRDAISVSGTGDVTELDNTVELNAPRRLAGGGSLADTSLSASGVLRRDALQGHHQPPIVKPQQPPPIPLFTQSRIAKARGQLSTRSTNRSARSTQEAKKSSKMMLVKHPLVVPPQAEAKGRGSIAEHSPHPLPLPPPPPSPLLGPSRLSPSAAVTNALQQALAAAAAAAAATSSTRRSHRCASATSFASGITTTTTARSEVSGHLDAAAVDRAVEAAIKAALSSVFSAVQGDAPPDSALLRALGAPRPPSVYAESTQSGVSDHPPNTATTAAAAVLEARRSAMIQTQLKIQAHTQTPLHSAISISSELCSSSAADLNAIGESNLKSLLYDCLRLYKLYADLDELDKALGCDTRSYITEGSEQCAIKGTSDHLLSNESGTAGSRDITASAPCTRNCGISGIWNLEFASKRPPLTAPCDLGKRRPIGDGPPSHQN